MRDGGEAAGGGVADAAARGSDAAFLYRLAPRRRPWGDFERSCARRDPTSVTGPPQVSTSWPRTDRSRRRPPPAEPRDGQAPPPCSTPRRRRAPRGAPVRRPGAEAGRRSRRTAWSSPRARASARPRPSPRPRPAGRRRAPAPRAPAPRRRPHPARRPTRSARRTPGCAPAAARRVRQPKRLGAPRRRSGGPRRPRRARHDPWRRSRPAAASRAPTAPSTRAVERDRGRDAATGANGAPTDRRPGESQARSTTLDTRVPRPRRPGPCGRRGPHHRRAETEAIAAAIADAGRGQQWLTTVAARFGRATPLLRGVPRRRAGPGKALDVTAYDAPRARWAPSAGARRTAAPLTAARSATSSPARTASLRQGSGGAARRRVALRRSGAYDRVRP